ncbi:hypothetical protein [Streptomyces anulatus]|uniref:hypothetical protein n=1 Tax=Streptomyces anulatus TaxID=1892 RepID=UPI002259B5C0|nr:hypothetical protein [Streptomyces anulatus]MCX4504576.1 hypothetical protein [Streptomyces anulatus]
MNIEPVGPGRAYSGASCSLGELHGKKLLKVCFVKDGRKYGGLKDYSSNEVTEDDFKNEAQQLADEHGVIVVYQAADYTNYNRAAQEAFLDGGRSSDFGVVLMHDDWVPVLPKIPFPTSQPEGMTDDDWAMAKLTQPA